MNQPNIPQFYKTLKLLFIFFLSGQVLFGGVVWWLLWHQQGSGHSVFTNESFLAGIILVWMIIAAFVLYKQRRRRVQHLKTLPAKMNHYRTSCIFRWAMLELGNLAVIGIAFMDLNSRLMLLFAIGIAVFFLTMPSKETFKQEYGEEL
jgi:divalent metal cation (Fe/Co/Zn/Cd) transporter